MPKFTNYTEKTVPVAADKLIIADSENSNNPKSLQTGNAAMAKSSSIFTVADGVSVTAGDVVSMLTDGTVAKGLTGTHLGAISNINAADTEDISATKLTNSTFVVAYQDVGNSSYGTAIIGAIADGVVTFGSEYVYNSSTTTDCAVTALSATKIVIAFKDAGNSSYGTAIIGDVSGTTITFGAEYVFNAAATLKIAVATMSATKFVVIFKDAGNSNYGTAIIGDVSGTTITFGSEYVYNAAVTNDYFGFSVAALSATKMVVSYRDDGNSGYGTAIISDVSGTTITFGSEYVYNAGSTSYLSTAALSATKFVIAFRDFTDGAKGKGIVGDVSGTTITFGAEYVFNAVSTFFCSASKMSATKFAVVYKDDGGDDYGIMRVGTVSGTTISFGSESIYSPANTTYNSVVALDALNIAVAFRDESDFDHGKATLIGMHGDMTGKVGVSQESGAETESIIVTIDKLSTAHTGLTPASFYYSSVWGDISTSVSDTPIGFALSATEILSNAFTFSDIFSGATTLATAAADDLILIYDTSESAIRKMTQANFTAI